MLPLLLLLTAASGMGVAGEPLWQPDPTYPRKIPHANLSCPANHCLLAGNRGCTSAVMGGVNNCVWPSLAAAQAGCAKWRACGGFMCGEDGRCFARSWSAVLHTGLTIASTVYLKDPPGPPPAPPPAPRPPYPKGFPPPQQPGPNLTGWTHGWDCISCPSNSMLSANIGTNDLTRFNLSSPWWVEELATHYAHIQMSPFLGSNFYNDTTCTPKCLSLGPYACTCGEHPLKTMARALKKINPEMKVQLYLLRSMSSSTSAPKIHPFLRLMWTNLSTGVGTKRSIEGTSRHRGAASSRPTPSGGCVTIMAT